MPEKFSFRAAQDRDDDLRVVAKARDRRVADAAGDDEGIAPGGERAGGVRGEELAPGAEQPADEGQAHDAAVGVAAENGICGEVGVFFAEIVAVGKEQD